MKKKSPRCWKTCTNTICCCCQRRGKYKVAVTKAVLVRLMLIAHIIMTTWRVSLAWDDQRFWLWSLGTLIIIMEGQFTILKNNGLEWKWFCPVFAIYLAIVLPLIWFLEISQMNKYLNSIRDSNVPPTYVSTTTSGLPTTTSGLPTAKVLGITTTQEGATQENNTVFNSTFSVTTSAEIMSTSSSVLTTSTDTLTTPQVKDLIHNLLRNFDADTWVVVVEESLVYLIVIGRWLLPRGGVSREALSDLLIDYLAMASDIMELFALFDQEEVRGNANMTYAILGIWSISFLQFIPVMVNRRAVSTEKRTGGLKNNRKNIPNTCGEHGIDIFVALTALVLQDGPFLVLRVFIIVYLRILTYSLVFFVLKNIIVVLLLTYRLFILCTRLPCCCKLGLTSEETTCPDGALESDPESPLDRSDLDPIVSPTSEKSKLQFQISDANENETVQ